MKRWLVALGAGLWLSGAAAQVNPSLAPADLRSFGAPSETKIYVFSSFSCPHCAVYHQNVLPQLAREFAAAGSAQILIVDMARESWAVAASLLGRCLPPAQYEAFAATVYRNQPALINAPAARAQVEGYARLMGLSDDEITQCLGNQALKTTVAAQRDNLSALYKVRGMPTTVLIRRGQPLTLTGTDAAAIIRNIRKELEN